MEGFGYFLKHEREKREWTQTEFGAKIGINSSAVSRIENGNQVFSKSKLHQLSNLFGVDYQDIIDRFFADKFVREALKFNCSDSVFKIAEETANYYKLKNAKQGVLELWNED